MKIVSILLIVFFIHGAAFAWDAKKIHGLNEAMSRKSRYSSTSFFPNESTIAPFFWQPETLCYTDGTTGSETWRMTYNPRQGEDIYSKEYSTQAFSGDGSRLFFFDASMSRPTPTRMQKSTSRRKWIVNTDGSKLRLAVNAGNSIEYPNWLHTERAAFVFPSDGLYELAGTPSAIVKISLDEDNNSIKSVLLSSVGKNRSMAATIKDPIASDDSIMVLQDNTKDSWNNTYPIDCKMLFFVDLKNQSIYKQWGAYRGIGPLLDPMFNLNGTCEYGFRGSSSALINGKDKSLYAHYGDGGACGSIQGYFQMALSGSALDGGPSWQDWDGDSYGANEIKAVSDNAGSINNLPHNHYANCYLGHPAFDRWGHFVLGDNSQDCNQQIYPNTSPPTVIRSGNYGCPGYVVLDMHNDFANPQWCNDNASNYLDGIGYHASHCSWTAWSDYYVGTVGGTPLIKMNHYQKTGEPGKANTQNASGIADYARHIYGINTHAATPNTSVVITDGEKKFTSSLVGKKLSNLTVDRLALCTITGNTESEINATCPSWVAFSPGDAYQIVVDTPYTALPRPSQSPDGTKVAYATTMFTSGYYEDENATDDGKKMGINYTVAYYPYPPEITSVSTSNGGYTIRFDWRLGTINPRGYTKRGWPNEDTDTPPPPRETKQFRLWRSTDGVAWSPVAAMNANIFERYNFKTGVWNGDSYWEFNDSPGQGLFYYAVTSVEHSGLESRSLSNVIDCTGAAFSQYPDFPGSKSNFCATFQPQITRYYNIYAHDDGYPVASQSSRIASIPVSSVKNYSDWLTNQNGSTQYVVTPVDSQGNEGGPLNAAVTFSNGRAAVSWADIASSIVATNGTGGGPDNSTNGTDPIPVNGTGYFLREQGGKLIKVGGKYAVTH